MQDQVNGHGPAVSPAEEGKPEFPYVRNVIPDGSATEVLYTLPNGHFAAKIVFKTMNPDALVAAAEDFLQFSRMLQTAAAQARERAAQGQPRVAVAGADALGKLKRS